METRWIKVAYGKAANLEKKVDIGGTAIRRKGSPTPNI